MAEPLPIIYGAVLAAGLDGLEPRHREPLACSPLGVCLTLGHQRTGKSFAEVLVAFGQKEVCSFIYRSTGSVQSCSRMPVG